MDGFFSKGIFDRWYNKSEIRWIFFFFFRENWTKLEFEEGQLTRGWWRSSCWFWRKICERWFVMYILFLSDSYFYDIFLIEWNWYMRGECLFVDLSKEEGCKNFVFLWRDVSLIIRNLGTINVNVRDNVFKIRFVWNIIFIKYIYYW